MLNPLPEESVQVIKAIRNVVREKKRDYVGKIPKRRTPPTHPPSLGNPCYQKKKLGLFFILGPQEHFWSSPKNHHFG